MAINFDPLRQQQMPVVPMQPSPTMPNQGVIDPMMNVGPEMPMGMLPEDDIVARMQQLYSPETQATERMNALLSEMPKRNKPGFWRKLGASAVAIKNPGLVEHALYSPYEHELADWKEKFVPAHQAANLERYANANERAFANQLATQDLAVRKQESREKTDAEKLRIADARAKAYVLKQNMGPGKKFDFSGPEVLVADPVSGQVQRTGIMTGDLDETTKILMQGDIASQHIKERGDQSRMTRKVIADRGSSQIVQEFNEDGTPGEVLIVDKRTGVAKPILRESEIPGEKPTEPIRPIKTESPYQQTQRFKTTVERFKLANPDLARFLKFKKDGTLDEKKLKVGTYSGPTQEQHQRIQQGLLSKTGTQTSNAPKAPPGWKYVPKEGGGWTAVKE